MGNYFIFPAPKSSYTVEQYAEMLHFISRQDNDTHYFNCLKTSKKIDEPPKIPALYIRSLSKKSPFLIIYFHGNSEDLGRVFPMILNYYEEFEVIIALKIY